MLYVAQNEVYKIGLFQEPKVVRSLFAYRAVAVLPNELINPRAGPGAP